MPTLYVFSGLPGSGKSTLANALAPGLNAAYLRIDTIEQRLRELFGVNIVEQGYLLAYSIAGDMLDSGVNVISDSCNPIGITRDAWGNVATSRGLRCINIEVFCSDVEEHRHRVENRTVNVPGLILPRWQDVVDREYDSWDQPVIRVDTAGSSVNDSLISLRQQLEQSDS